MATQRDARGSRNRLTDSVLKKIAEDFAENGDEVLARVRTEEPALYLKFIIIATAT